MPQIKEFTPKDVAKIAAIERICFADAWSLDMIKTESSQQKFCALVIEEQDETLGFIMGSVLFEDAEIYKVAILPQHRGKGLGSMAVNAFVDKVKERGGERIFLGYARRIRRLCGCIKTAALKKIAFANGIMRTARTLI